MFSCQKFFQKELIIIQFYTSHRHSFEKKHVIKSGSQEDVTIPFFASIQVLSPLNDMLVYNILHIVRKIQKSLVYLQTHIFYFGCLNSSHRPQDILFCCIFASSKLFYF